MIRTRAMLVSATAAACLAGVAAGSIGAAQATTASTGTTGATGTSGTTGTTGTTATTATSTPATITMNGAAIATVDTSVDVATQHAAYLTALGNAVSDAQTKANALATQVGDKLGAVQNLTEQSSDSGGGFCGTRVFMGASGVAKGAPSVAPARRPSKKKAHPAVTLKNATAQISDVAAPTTCTIEADVTVTFAMG
jgi:uncharacterized protein YggE